MDVVEANLGSCLLQFDGRVLEFFGGKAESSWRRHVALMTAVVVTGPDKRGDRAVAFQPPSSLITIFMVNETELEALQPILDALQAAGLSVAHNP